MAIPFLNDINLNENELLNAKLHTDSSAPSNPGTGSVWFDTGTNLLKIYRGGSWTNLFVKTEAIANGGTNLGTADQIHTFVTTQSDTIAASTSGTAAIATTVTVADESSDTTCFPLFATAATGNLGPKSGTNLTFNSDTGILTATGFAGNITGNVTGNADTVTTNANLTGDVTSSGNATTIAADAVHATMINDDIISAQTELASGVADADEILISDSGAVKKVGMDTLKTYFTGDDVSIANLTARLPQITESLTIGDATDVTITTSGGLIVTGDLTVSGDTTTVNTATLTVEDPLIKLAKGNTSADSVDIGLFGTYNNGATQLYTGFFRDASDSGKWILYKDSEADPGTGTTVNVSGTGHAVATLKANLEGNVTGTISTASQTNITAIGTIATGVWEATDIAIAHGGTGASTASAAFDNLKQAATATATGVVELATTTEASTGTDTSRAITAEGLQQFHNDRNKSFELDNSASGVASTDNITYTITHGMGASRLYKVEVIEDASNYETVYAEVQRPSDTTIKVIFGSAVTAGAYRALITKI